ncbi:MAG: hypothetical protein R2881_04045 [Eubacteriales bacterium]
MPNGWTSYGFHRSIGHSGAPVHDAVAVAALIKPEIMTMVDMYVAVEPHGRLLPRNNRWRQARRAQKPANARVIMDIDREAFVDLLAEAAAHMERRQAYEQTANAAGLRHGRGRRGRHPVYQVSQQP